MFISLASVTPRRVRLPSAQGKAPSRASAGCISRVDWGRGRLLLVVIAATRTVRSRRGRCRIAYAMEVAMRLGFRRDPAMAWIDDYLAAWNEHDPVAVTDFMTNDVVYTDFGLGEEFKGIEA